MYLHYRRPRRNRTARQVLHATLAQDLLGLLAVLALLVPVLWC